MKSNPNKKRCLAKTRSGGKCQSWVIPGRDRCRLHGGASPRGLAHPPTKHGRDSVDLPTRLLASYQQAISDPDLLNLNEEIALHTVRLRELLGRLDTVESAALWTDLRIAWGEFAEAQARRDTGAMGRLMQEIGDLITRGHSDSAAWRELLDTADKKRKAIESEGKRRIAMKTMITSERAGLLILALTDSVKTHVHDPDTLISILSDFGAILGTDGAG